MVLRYLVDINSGNTKNNNFIYFKTITSPFLFFCSYFRNLNNYIFCDYKMNGTQNFRKIFRTL